ncbi:hypothetical protein C8Q80DRAFT_332389 [Daedaleopsis nitida]|nr:hypothetical protein C8Q80DRAFT_332389 [Daedaleopsis nitida]
MKCSSDVGPCSLSGELHRTRSLGVSVRRLFAVPPLNPAVCLSNLSLALLKPSDQRHVVRARPIRIATQCIHSSHRGHLSSVLELARASLPALRVSCVHNRSPSRGEGSYPTSPQHFGPTARSLDGPPRVSRQRASPPLLSPGKAGTEPQELELGTRFGPGCLMTSFSLRLLAGSTRRSLTGPLGCENDVDVASGVRHARYGGREGV